jgi:hypothetical protein
VGGLDDRPAAGSIERRIAGLELGFVERRRLVVLARLRALASE